MNLNKMNWKEKYFGEWKLYLKWCRPQFPERKEAIENIKELISIDFICFVLKIIFNGFSRNFQNK